jgi:hypothetical protein
LRSFNEIKNKHKISWPYLPSFKYLEIIYDEGMGFIKYLKLSNTDLRRAFKTEDSRFILSVGLKVSGISLGITFVIYWFVFQVMKLNYAFFRAHGFPHLPDDNPFFDLIIQDTLENFNQLFFFYILLFFIGCYVGWLIIRPFKAIGDYCEKVLDNPNISYNIEAFSTYSLLTRFSEFFFEFLRETRKKKDIQVNSIPPQYLRIHKPVSDRVFMLHFGLLLIIISISSAVFIIENTSTIYNSMVELAIKTLKDQKSVSKYFSEQMFILDDIVWLTISMIVFFYVSLGIHLYSKVSGAAFGIFSTMRSFMKGNHFSRVHLVGFIHLREYTRKLNRYLDYIENNFSKDKPKN